MTIKTKGILFIVLSIIFIAAAVFFYQVYEKPALPKIIHEYWFYEDSHGD